MDVRTAVLPYISIKKVDIFMANKIKTSKHVTSRAAANYKVKLHLRIQRV